MCNELPHLLMAASNHIVAAITESGTHQRKTPSMPLSSIPMETSKLCSQAAVKRCQSGRS